MNTIGNVLNKIGIHVPPKKKFSDLSVPQFMLLLTYLFNAMEYTIKLAGKTSNQGGDMVIHTEHDLVVVQLKYNRNEPVGVDDISAAILAQKYYGCPKTMIITTLKVTKEAIKLAKVNNVEIIEKKQLEQWIWKYLKERWS